LWLILPVVVVFFAFKFIVPRIKKKMATVDTSLPIKLTSISVPQSEDGTYSFQAESFLFPHEPLRREMERGKRALDQIDLQKHAWKAKHLAHWMLKFWIPIIHEHHDSEEEVVIPYYRNLGVNIPDHVTDEPHKKLVESLSRLQSLVEQLVSSVDNEASQEEIAGKLSAVRAEYAGMYSLMVEHLAEEERYWPSVILEKGQEQWVQCNADLHKYTKSLPNGKIFLMSMLDAMGVAFDGFPHNPQHDTRWCGEALVQEKILGKIPWFVVSWIFPGINKNYQHFKAQIAMVADGTEETVSVEYNPDSCVIC
jgi:DNA-binding FrmR family transcriptional regulator